MVAFQGGNDWIKDTDWDRFWNWTRLEEISPTTRRYLTLKKSLLFPPWLFSITSEETPGNVISGIKSYICSRIVKHYASLPCGRLSFLIRAFCKVVQERIFIWYHEFMMISFICVLFRENQTRKRQSWDAHVGKKWGPNYKPGNVSLNNLVARVFLGWKMREPGKEVAANEYTIFVFSV